MLAAGEDEEIAIQARPHNSTKIIDAVCLADLAPEGAKILKSIPKMSSFLMPISQNVCT